MSENSHPLRCLVCCTTLAATDQSLPVRAYQITTRLRDFANMAADKLHPLGLRREPPEYVRRLQAMPPEERGLLVDELRSQVGPVKVLLITTELR